MTDTRTSRSLLRQVEWIRQKLRLADDIPIFMAVDRGIITLEQWCNLLSEARERYPASTSKSPPLDLADDLHILALIERGCIHRADLMAELAINPQQLQAIITRMCNRNWIYSNHATQIITLRGPGVNKLARSRKMAKQMAKQMTTQTNDYTRDSE